MRLFPTNIAVLLLVVLGAGSQCDPARAQGALKPIDVAPEVLDATRQLQLAVIVNGEDLRLAEFFTYQPSTKKLSIKRSDLAEASVKTPPGAADESLDLDSLGVKYQYDEVEQKIEFTLTDEQRLPRMYNVQKQADRPKPHSDLGALVNYSIFGGSVRDMNTGKIAFNGVNAQLDARIFSDFGLLEQSGVVGSTLVNSGGAGAFLRSDTTYSFSDPETSITYRAGDTVSGGTAWSRPIHLGGAQVSRDFTLRSDVVTQPLPIVSGTAATPSTVDVLVNGSKVFSQQVAPGPFSIANLPIIASGGLAQVQIRDATGRTVNTTLSLFNPARMLSVGLSDFSLEGGLARRNYGVLSNDYLTRPIGSGTYRYGLASWLTLESHAEGGAGLENIGAGAIAGLGVFGTLNLAATGSHSTNGVGGQVYGDWQLQFGKVSFSIGSQRTFSNYDDLASVTANYAYNPTLQPVTQFGTLPSATSSNSYVSPRPARALDRLAIGFPVFDDKSSLSLGLINLVQQDNTKSRLITASFSRSLPWRQGNLFASSFADLGDKKSFGASIGLSFALWEGVSSAFGSSYDNQSRGALTAEISKSQPQIDDTWGWRLRGDLGENTAGEANASYRSSFGLAQADVTQNRTTTTSTGQFDGSIAVLGGGVFAGNKTDTSFAVVDTGAPGVAVTQDGRNLGKTGSSGKFLVPNLRAWEVNNIGIDTDGLSVSYDADRTAEVVVPRAKGGAYVNFGGRANVVSAIVVFVGADGKPLEIGLKGHLEGKTETFLVGRDGRAYVKDLGQDNTALIDLGNSECRAEFHFEPVNGRQGIVRGVTCK